MSDQLSQESRSGTLWHRILGAAMAIPGATVDRASYLESQLTSHCPREQVAQAIRSRPAVAGISPDLIDSLADSSTRSHVLKATSISFATGLPGGWAMAATIPADLAQYFWNAIVLCQKLAYLYGWPDLLEDGELDEEAELRITLLIGAMMGAAKANRLLSGVAARFAAQVAQRLPRQALTKTAYYPIVKVIGPWIGVQVTKQSFARGLSRVIPVIGAATSAALTATLMWPMASRLKNHLRTLRFADSN